MLTLFGGKKKRKRKKEKRKKNTIFFKSETRMTTIILLLEKGDYPENSHAVFCPNKYHSFELKKKKKKNVSLYELNFV